MPLVKGHYGTQNPMDSLLGQPRNATIPNLPARSNCIGAFTPVDTASVLVSGSSTFVAVPVEPGDAITNITILVGNTAASTPTHFSIGLYSGVLTTAKLLGTQSTDTTTTAMAANTALVTAYGAVYTIQNADAPYGYIYVALGYTGTTSFSAMGFTGSTKDYAFPASTIFTHKPLACGTQAVGGAGTMPATVTLASSTSQAATPYVWLS